MPPLFSSSFQSAAIYCREPTSLGRMTNLLLLCCLLLSHGSDSNHHFCVSVCQRQRSALVQLPVFLSPHGRCFRHLNHSVWWSSRPCPPLSPPHLLRCWWWYEGAWQGLSLLLPPGPLHQPICWLPWFRSSQQGCWWQVCHPVWHASPPHPLTSIVSLPPEVMSAPKDHPVPLGAAWFSAPSSWDICWEDSQ